MKLKDYLHFYPECPIVIIEKSIEDNSEIRTCHYLEGIDWTANKVIAERVNWDYENIKLILNPIRTLTEEEFQEISKALWGTDEIICLYLKDMWLSTSKDLYEDSKKDMYDEDEKNIDDGDIFSDLDEANFDNVISYNFKNRDITFSYGIDAEYQFSLDLKSKSILFKKLLEMRFDLFGLIKNNLAIEE